MGRVVLAAGGWSSRPERGSQGCPVVLNGQTRPLRVKRNVGPIRGEYSARPGRRKASVRHGGIHSTVERCMVAGRAWWGEGSADWLERLLREKHMCDILETHVLSEGYAMVIHSFRSLNSKSWTVQDSGFLERSRPCPRFISEIKFQNRVQ